jgi:hypothetical protein
VQIQHPEDQGVEFCCGQFFHSGEEPSGWGSTIMVWTSLNCQVGRNSSSFMIALKCYEL